MKLSHLDEASRARMVDVGGKPETERTATAEGLVRMSREAYEQVARTPWRRATCWRWRRWPG